mgnify:CR=1 FL=1
MSKISRRNFMKCAGAAALAVAAAGALSGCDTTLSVDVYFYANGTKLELTGTGRVQSGAEEMDTSTIELPAEYIDKYEIADAKVKVIREDGKRYANVNLAAKEVTYQVYYKLGDTTVLTGEVTAAAVNPTITVDDLNQSEKKELAEKFYQLTGDVRLSNNTVIVLVEKIMGDVKVEYWYKGFSEKHWQNGYYDEELSIWKGENSFNKSELKKLHNACYDSDSLDESKVQNTFTFDWSNPVVKVYLSY